VSSACAARAAGMSMSSRIIRAHSEAGLVSQFDFAALATVPAAAFRPPEPVDASAPAVETAPAETLPPPAQPTAAQLGHTHDEVELVLRQARVKASEIEKEAYEKGFSEGERAGRETGEKMVEAVLKQYTKTLEELKGLRHNLLTGSEREVVRLALEVAKKVVKREASVDDELILALVKVALSRLADQSVMTVRVNPKDCQSILQYRESPGHRDSWHDGIKLVEDPLITRGGCLIETDSGVIDARVEEQFREIEKGFFE
jgi:flagellar assembly protein FliH